MTYMQIYKMRKKAVDRADWVNKIHMTPQLKREIISATVQPVSASQLSLLYMRGRAAAPQPARAAAAVKANRGVYNPVQKRPTAKFPVRDILAGLGAPSPVYYNQINKQKAATQPAPPASAQK